jgi:pyruvate dehydrogenase E1 component beta subunit
VPSTPADAKGLLAASIRDDDLVVFFEHKLMYDITGEVPEGEYVVPLGKADVKREGDSATVIAIGRMVQFALEAADQLSGEGIQVEVVDPRTLSPLDSETILDSVRKTGRVVMVDEDNPRCSMATDITALVATNAFDSLDAPPQLVMAPHTPVPFAPEMEDFYIPSVERIVSAVRATL